MNESSKKEFEEHAKQCAPREACGLTINVSGKEVFWPCRNIAENQTDFVMHPEDYATAEDYGEIMAVIHSHPISSAMPTPADLVGCEGSGLPWFIFSIPSGVWKEITPKGYEAPLVGRPFCHGVLDCYSLVIDWYKRERKIELPDFERREEWWNKGDNLYLDNFEKAGFYAIDPKDIQKGDVILMQIHSKTVNHAAIYLGNGVMLHHLMKRLSCREVYGGYFQKNTRLVIRHRGTN